jgi:hypothetical protein
MEKQKPHACVLKNNSSCIPEDLEKPKKKKGSGTASLYLYSWRCISTHVRFIDWVFFLLNPRFQFESESIRKIIKKIIFMDKRE